MYAQEHAGLAKSEKTFCWAFRWRVQNIQNERVTCNSLFFSACGASFKVRVPYHVECGLLLVDDGIDAETAQVLYKRKT